MVEHILNHEDEAQARLLSQFKGSPRIEGLLSSFVAGQQGLEDVLWALYIERQLDTASGEQLDNLGTIVREERKGRNDVNYRIGLIGKIGRNISKGTVNDLITIFKLLMSAEIAYFEEYFPAECAIYSDTPPIEAIERLTDGNMEAVGTGAWTVVNDATLTKSAALPHGGTQALRIAHNGIDNPGASQNILTVGQWYRITGYVCMQDDLGNIPVIQNGAETIWEGDPFTEWYEFDVIFLATDSSLILGSDFTAANWLEYDDVSVRRVMVELYDDVFEICDSVLGGGIRLIVTGWYEDERMFSFEGDPDGLGFGDLDDPRVGGKFASIMGST